ncbi:hypothetical protein UFOVP451_5 [uncultured Caudovirales phage]|uniref:Uncharacterized protein n=1 Tax=uncultured Caudovirales phage TaxID=2100421 RepID=A0A6J5MBD0_9CAUD|nr:hypothetical protein UFOVP451_5 [uncultured Caudovirales phage]
MANRRNPSGSRAYPTGTTNPQSNRGANKPPTPPKNPIPPQPRLVNPTPGSEELVTNRYVPNAVNTNLSNTAKTAAKVTGAAFTVAPVAVMGGDEILENVKDFLSKGQSPILQKQLTDYYRSAMTDEQYADAAKRLANYSKSQTSQNLNAYRSYVEPFNKVAQTIRQDSAYGMPVGMKAIDGRIFGGFDLGTGKPIYYNQAQWKLNQNNLQKIPAIVNGNVVANGVTVPIQLWDLKNNTYKKDLRSLQKLLVLQNTGSNAFAAIASQIKQLKSPTTTPNVVPTPSAPTPTPTPSTSKQMQTQQQKEKAKQIVDKIQAKTNAVSKGGNTVVAQNPKTNVMAAPQGGGSLLEQYKALVGVLPDSDPQMQSLKKAAAQEYKDQMAGFDSRLNQLSALRQQDMGSLRRNADVAQSKLDDKMFQQYLQTRENMGVRGLSNSGLMADAQIRLGMNKQDALADLFARTQSQIGDVNRMYAPQQQQLLGERQGVRQSEIEQAMLDRFNQQRSQQAQALGNLLPYYELTAGQKADIAQQQERMKFEREQAAAAATRSSGGAGGGAGGGTTAMPNDAKGWVAKVKNIQNDIDDVVANINGMESNDPNLLAAQQEYAKLKQQRDIAQEIANAYQTGNAQALTAARKAYDSLVNPAKEKAPTKSQQSNIDKRAIETGKFQKLVDLGTNIDQAPPGSGEGYLADDTDPAEMLRRALEIAKQTGQKVPISASRMENINNYASGTLNTRKYGMNDTLRGLFNAVPGVTGVGQLMRNAKAVKDVLSRYPGYYDIVADK